MMEQHGDDLWKGGPWEQPTPAITPLPDFRVPAGAMMPRKSLMRKKQRGRRRPWLLGLALLIAVACLSAWLTALWLERAGLRAYLPFGQTHAWEEEQTTDSKTPGIPRAETGTGVTLSLEAPGTQELSFAEIYEKNAKSVVSIRALGRSGSSTAAGIIMTEDGYIITNAHVVAGAQEVQVILSDNSVFRAGLVGFEAGEDLAVLKVSAGGLSPAQFGDSHALKIGEPVAALGDPLGYRSTLTDGIISALDREAIVDGSRISLIQTSASINFGNSGGALLNRYGQVVGITTAKIVSQDGSVESLGFAIPSRRVKYVVDTLIDGREVRTGMFGFTVYTVPEEDGGLSLKEVDRRSDAWAKGLRAGDVIRSADGIPVNAIQDLARVKRGLGPGDEVELTYLRNGELCAVSVALMDEEELNSEEAAG